MISLILTFVYIYAYIKNCYDYLHFKLEKTHYNFFGGFLGFMFCYGASLRGDKNIWTDEISWVKKYANQEEMKAPEMSVEMTNTVEGFFSWKSSCVWDIIWCRHILMNDEK